MADRLAIERKLADPDEELRLQGLRELCQEQESSPPLGWIYRALGDSSWRVRKEAVELFLGLPAATSLSGEIVELLHAEDNAGLRNAAMEVLVRLGEAAVPTLLEELDCNDPDVRKFSLDALGEIGAPGALGSIVGALRDPDRNVRTAAAENLGKLGSEEAVPSLLDAMGEPDPWLRFTILEAIGQIGSGEASVAQLLEYRDDPMLRKALFDCLGRVGNGEAVAALVEGLGDSMRNVREAAAQALDRIARAGHADIEAPLRPLKGTTVADGLAEMLRSGDPEVARAAVRLLGLIGDPRHAEALLAIMEGEELREEASAALIHLGAGAVEELEGLWTDSEPLRRVCLAYLFGATACVAGRPRLREGLGQDYPLLRMVSARALGEVGDPEDLDDLLGVLEGDDEEEVRQAVLEGICAIGQRFPGRVRERLRPALQFGEPEVRMTVVTVLGRLGGEGVAQELVFALKDESPLVRQGAIKALEQSGSAEALESLMLALTDEEGEVRKVAAEALGTSGSPQALEPLGLALEDEDFWVRAAAVRALGRIGLPEAWDRVARALEDPVGLVGIAALETLDSLDPRRTYPHLTAALGREDEEVVLAALQLLAAGGRKDWLQDAVGRLLDHPHWEVRSAFCRVLADQAGPASRASLERRLLVEGEELVRQQIRDLLSSLPGE